MTTSTRPRLDELEATLRDQAKVTAMLRDGKFGEFVKDYAEAKNEANTDLAVAVREETQRVLAQMLKENGAAPVRRVNLDPDTGVKDLARRKGAVYNAAAPGAKIDESKVAPAGTAEYLQAIWHHANTLSNGADLAAKANEWRKIQNSFGSVVPADGGFLIPETLRSEILQLALEESIVRSKATVIPMTSLAVPIPTVDEASHASSVFGGIVAFWTEEGAAATESQAKFGRVRLESKKLTIYCEMPNELVADAPAFGGFLDMVLPQAVAFYEDAAFLTGTGVGEPLGVLNGPGLISATRTTASRVKFQDIIAMYARMLPGSLNRAVWVISPAVVPELLQLVLPTGGTGNETVAPPLWLTNQQAISAPTMTLLGRPVFVTEKAPTLGTSGDIAFIDFTQYLIGDRQIAQATSSPHFKFSSDVTAYKITERVDGRPWLNTAITPKNGGATLSPYVKITT